MRSVTTTKFRKAFEKLPLGIKQKARRTYTTWKENPYHPSLHFKQVHDTQPIFSVRISLFYRAIGIREEDVMIWFWIGSHEEYNNLVKQI